MSTPAPTPARTSPSSAGEEGASLRPSRKRHGEQVVLWLLWGCAALSIVTTIAIVGVLAYEGATFFTSVDIVAFFTDTVWQPFGDPGNESFRIGIWPLVNGTLLVTAIALAVAVPVGLAAAMYLSEYAPARVRKAVKPALEVLAGVPTVVLGYFALTFVTPFVLRPLFGVELVDIFNAASAGLVTGIMLIPMVASLSEDALSSVPNSLRAAALGLGATKRHTVLRVVTPAALSGIVAAVILALGRAIGETMIVAIAAGNLPDLTLNPFGQIQTMTAYIVQAVTGEAPRGSLTYQSIFAVGGVLFALTFAANLIAQRVVARFRQVY